MTETANERVNVYVCPECGGYTVTIDVDKGVTPFLLNCRASGREGDCDGMAQSSFYPKGPRPAHIPAPAWEWYKPTEQEAREADERAPGMWEHAQKGGLFIRRRVPPNWTALRHFDMGGSKVACPLREDFRTEEDYRAVLAEWERERRAQEAT